MNLQQLRYLQGIAEHGFNVSRAATALHTSQPGISKQIQMLEQEIGIAILVRKGNRIIGVTEPGQAILDVARRMLHDADNLKRIGEDFTARDAGRLVVATTHMHARYVLRDVIRDFIRRHPNVQLVLHQASPAQTAQLVTSGEADIGVSSQPVGATTGLVMLPCYELHRSVITPKGHPLLSERRLTLKTIAKYPIITLDQSFVGGSAVVHAFDRAGMRPNIVLSAIDADVVKTYVELGLGIAILPTIAYEPRRDTKLRAIDAAKLFEPTVACIELRRENYLRSYMLDFIQRIAAQWDREAITHAMRTADANIRQSAP